MGRNCCQRRVYLASVGRRNVQPLSRKSVRVLFQLIKSRSTSIHQAQISRMKAERWVGPKLGAKGGCQGRVCLKQKTDSS